MKFFKHFTDAHEGYSMQALMNQFGLKGYAAYFILLEMCAAKLEKERHEELTDAHCQFRFNERLLREKLRLSSAKVELMLNQCSTLDLLSFSKIKDEFNIQMPKLLESLDRQSKRARPERGQSVPKDKDKDKDKDIYAVDESTAATDPINSEELNQLKFTGKELGNLWNANCDPLPKIRGCEGKRLKRANAAVQENPSIEDWRKAIGIIKANDFCLGKKNDWIANFDWFIRAGKITEILEGNFRPTNQTGDELIGSVDFEKMGWST
jgi:hypothetical protein